MGSSPLQTELFDLVVKTVVGASIPDAVLDDFYESLRKLSATAPEGFQRDLAEVFWLLWIKIADGEKRAGLVELMKLCLRDKKLDKRVAMEVLENDCMQQIGLVESNDHWRKKEIRYNTKTLYTVSKYNLMREVSEGYAKLVVALNMFGDAALDSQRVSLLYKEIQALIGYFDLDPNRVLDLVLEAAEVQPHNRAYLELVPLFKREAVAQLMGFKFQHYQKASSGPAPENLYLLAAALIQSGLASLELLLPHLAPSDADLKQAQEVAVEELRKEVENIGVINLNAPAAIEGQAGEDRPGPGALVPQQADPRGMGMGAPMRAPTPGEPPMRAPVMMGMGPPQGPHGGIIAQIHARSNMGAPYGPPGGQYGGPPGYGMDYDPRDGPGLTGGAFRAQSALRADAMNLDPSAKCEALLLPKNTDKNQKLALARALLQVGAYDAADVLMARLTALGMQPAAWAPLSAVLSEAVTEELAPILDRLAPKGVLTPGLLETAENIRKQLGDSATSAAIIAALPPVLKPGPPLSPRATRALLTLGPYLGRKPTLLIKAVRAVRHHYLFYSLGPATRDLTVAMDTDGPGAASGPAHELTRVEDVIRRSLLPASCLVTCMPALSFELWALLEPVPSCIRYRLYSDFQEQVERHPYLQAARKMAEFETKKVFKRLTTAADNRDLKEQVKPKGRLLAKIAASSPLALMNVALNMVEAYANHLEPLVESFRYMPSFAFDMLTYAILYHLSDGRAKVKDDGTNISDWLQNLAKFTGAVCRKYPEVDIFAVCQYLANALRGADSFDLLVLKEMVERNTGITVAVELSAEQLEGKMGGELLSSYVLQHDADKMGKAWARGGRRMLQALQRGPRSEHLALPLFILVAQQRQAIMIHTRSKDVKFMTGLFDKCHETCSQYLEFLQTALSPEDYQALMPSIPTLSLDYSLAPEIVFMAHRPMLQRLLKDLRSASPEEGEIEDPGTETEPGEAPGPMDTEGAPLAAGPDPSGAAATQREAQAAWHAMLEVVKASAPSQALWEALTPNLYALFWGLSIHDIYVPKERYNIELEKAKADLRQAEYQLSSARMGGPNMYKAMSEDELLDLGRRKDRLKTLVEKLPQELEAQQDRVKQTETLLAREKDKLVTTPATSAEFTGRIVSQCVLPRALCSPTDAAFCAKFPILLHNLNVPNFSTIWYTNRLYQICGPMIRCLTDHEAFNMSILLLDTFKIINHWRSSEEVFKEQCSANRVGMRGSTTDSKTITYDVFKKLVGKWHRITLANLGACLETKDYTSRRNALSILSRLLPVFPMASKHVEELKQKLEKVKAEETREDLSVSLKSYTVAFGAEMDKPNRVIPSEAFGDVLQGKSKKAGAKPAGATSSSGAVGSPGAKKPLPGSKPSAGDKRAHPAASANGGAAPAQQPDAGGSAAQEGAPGSSGSRLRADAPEFKLTAGLSNAGMAVMGGSNTPRDNAEEPRSSKRVKTEKPDTGNQDTGPAVKTEDAGGREPGSSKGSKREAPAHGEGAGASTSGSKRARIEPPSEKAQGERAANGDHGPAADREPSTSGREGRRKDKDKDKESRDKESGRERDRDRGEDKERSHRDKDKESRDKDRDRDGGRGGGKERGGGGSSAAKDKEDDTPRETRGEAREGKEGRGERDREREPREKDRDGKEGKRGREGRDEGLRGERDKRDREKSHKDKGEDHGKVKEEPDAAPANPPTATKGHKPIQPPAPREQSQPRDTEGRDGGSAGGRRGKHQAKEADDNTGGPPVPANLRDRLGTKASWHSQQEPGNEEPPSSKGGKDGSHGKEGGSSRRHKR